MSLKDFLLSKVFVKNLGIAVIGAVCIVIVLLIWMNIYTRHGQSRPVPDLYGMQIEDARKLARKNKLRFQVVDSIYTTVVGRGCVAEQNPKPGFKVKKWRRIMITLNAFSPEMVAVPDIVGLPIRQADAMLKTAGLETGQLRYIPDLSVDLVIRHLHNGKELNPGDSLQKGSVVDLVLGRGLSNERTPVPDLKGMELERAKNSLISSSLNLGTYIFDSSVLTSEDSSRAFVFKQIPEFREDATLQLGSSIYIWLTVDSTMIKSDSTSVALPDTLKQLETNR
ncbi:MAG: PASTA domain-containing protein [Bacteroidales bacterium]